MTAALDTSLPQLGADGVLVVLVAVNAYIGWHTGTLRRVIGAAGLYVGFIAAYYAGNSFAGLFVKNDALADAWAFVAITAAAVLVFELLGRVFNDRVQWLAVMTFDRFAGLFLGAVLGFFEAVVLFMVALAVGSPSSAPATAEQSSRAATSSAVRNGMLSREAIRVIPGVHAMFQPLGATDLAGHLEQSTPTAPPSATR